MTRRGNFDATMNHEQPENLILDLGGNPLSSLEGASMDNLLHLLGYKKERQEERLLFGKVQRIDERILKYLDIDTRSIGYIVKPKVSQFNMITEDEYVDEWGITRRYDGRYWDIVSNPLKDASIEDLDKYQWPEPESIDQTELERIELEAKNLFNNTDYVICAEHPVYGVFELGCWLCGFDDFLVRLMIDGDFVKKLFDIILSIQLKVIDIYYGKVGPYIHYTSSGDDFATQDNLFMPPNIFREMIKPYYRERVKRTKEKTKAYFLHHSCGAVASIIPDIIEVGVDILNPIQPEARGMEAHILKAEYGNEIVFHGGIGTQEEILKDESSLQLFVENTVSELNQNGGYIFAAAHNIQDDVTPENVVSLFKAGRKYGSCKAAQPK